MMGPLLSFDDAPHLERMLQRVRDDGIGVVADVHRDNSYWFRRGWGLVHGGVWLDAKPYVMYFGFGHPFNVLLWNADGRLLRHIESLFAEGGSKRLEPKDVNLA